MSHRLSIAAAAVLALAAAPIASRAQVPTLSVREELRIGKGAFTDELPEISSLVTGTDGRAYALSRSVEILIFDRRGRLLRRVPTISRDQPDGGLSDRARNLLDRVTGRIPAESAGNRTLSTGALRFSIAYDPLAMGWVGDTLWISRSGVTHVGLFDRNGDSTGALAFAIDIEGQRANTPRALLPDRSLLWSITQSQGEGWLGDRPIPRPPEMYRMPVIPGPPVAHDDAPPQGFLLRATPAGKVVQGLEIFTPPRRSAPVVNPRGVTAWIPSPFQDHPLIAVTPDGSEIVFVERYGARRPEQGRYVVVRFDGRTGRRTARAYPYVPIPVTPATRDSIVRRLTDGSESSLSPHFLAGFGSPAEARAAIERPLAGAEYHSPITDVIAGADRTVWLREHGTGAWLVLGHEGDVIGRVTLPRGARLLHANRDAAWALVTEGPAQTPIRTLVRYRVGTP